MKKTLLCAVLAAILLGGCFGEEKAGGVGITLSPAHGTSDVAIDAPVTATFSDVIRSPVDWTKVLILKKEGTEETVCTEVTYDASTRVASCVHPNLEGGVSYIAAVDGVTTVKFQPLASVTATFLTSSAALSVSTGTVSSFTKTSMASTSPGSIDITFNFSQAIPADKTAPSIDISSPTDTSVSLVSCRFNTARIALTCGISGVDGCKTLTDYTLTLSGEGYDTYTLNFNSADDEFDKLATLTSCWSSETTTGVVLSPHISDGQLAIGLPKGTSNQFRFYKKFDNNELAFSAFILDNPKPTSGTGMTGVLVDFRVPPSFLYWFSNLFSNSRGENLNSWGVSQFIGFGAITAIPKTDGPLYAKKEIASPFYICIVNHANVLKSYISTDGQNYIPLTTDNMECYGTTSDLTTCNSEYLPKLLSNNTSSLSWSEGVGTGIGASNQIIDTYTPVFGYVRYRSSGLSGTEDDCPMLP